MQVASTANCAVGDYLVIQRPRNQTDSTNILAGCHQITAVNSSGPTLTLAVKAYNSSVTVALLANLPAVVIKSKITCSGCSGIVVLNGAFCLQNLVLVGDGSYGCYGVQAGWAGGPGSYPIGGVAYIACTKPAGGTTSIGVVGFDSGFYAAAGSAILAHASASSGHYTAAYYACNAGFIGAAAAVGSGSAYGFLARYHSTIYAPASYACANTSAGYEADYAACLALLATPTSYGNDSSTSSMGYAAQFGSTIAAAFVQANAAYAYDYTGWYAQDGCFIWVGGSTYVAGTIAISYSPTAGGSGGNNFSYIT
jgi:hypothetical protein